VEYVFKVHCSDGVAITDELDQETSSQAGSISSERGIDIGRVGSWAMDFEKLLADPVGLRTFAVMFPSFFNDSRMASVLAFL
jgi:hypothetical protein